MTHNQLSEKAAEIATNRPRFWELALFAQVITDEIERQQGLASTLPLSTMAGEDSVIFQIDTRASLNEFVALVQSKLTELADLINQFSELLDANQNAFGLSGQSGDPEKIAQLGIQVGNLYATALVFENVVRVHHFDCSHYQPECLRANLNAVFTKVRGNLIAETSAVIQFYEGYGPEILRRIQDAVSDAQPDESLHVDLSMKFAFTFSDTINAADAFASIANEISIEADRICSDSPDKIIK